jgi:hypothetical protein
MERSMSRLIECGFVAVWLSIFLMVWVALP